MLIRRKRANEQERPNPTTEPVRPEYLTLQQAEIMTGLSQHTWRKYLHEGKVGSVKVKKRILIPLSEIRRLMAAYYRPAITR